MTAVRQDDLSRRRRLNAGRCPQHGHLLKQVDRTQEGLLVVGCPRSACAFATVVEPGSKLDLALRGA